MRGALLDRDGTINRKAAEGDYVKSRQEFEFLPGAVDAIVRLGAAGFAVVVITNQRGIALARMTEDELEEIHAYMCAEVARSGGSIAAVYHCPHDIGVCRCRKPGVELLERAERELGLVLTSSVVVGDAIADIEAGVEKGCRTVLIDPDRTVAPVAVERSLRVDHVVGSLADAAAWIVTH